MNFKRLIVILLLLAVLFTACSPKYEEVTAVTFPELSEKVDEDIFDISQKAKGLDGKTVEMVGYMSPLTPLDANYFYMIQVPGAACPFCGGEDVDFLQVIQVYYPEGKKSAFTEKALKATGELEVGDAIDDSGAKSIFRIKAETIEAHKFK
ncbi:hypothetical protein SAMN05446037_104525 [Anaerovirgula multivorans]|uniref:Lipoprotein n=1 Tax=Anaerovirgula multivorans TaxID=312168 RepID=A0A239KE32_9FIRM|nr:hypothetical protein [Anaerovirgula multivorans]SNT15374.1 hypothetical protein SAMN05446037_104525 [Anaerovirgula multivorans]